MKSKATKMLEKNVSSPISRPRAKLRPVQPSAPMTVAVLGVALIAGACDYKTSHEPTATGQEVFELCQQCHGLSGEGRREFNAPSIAGLPEWYVTGQLKKFRAGTRGTHPSDITGMQMRPMGMSLRSDGDIEVVAKYVSSLPRRVSAPILEGGNAERGKALYATCVACHGPTGGGVEQVKGPPLTHASDWYLLAQLQKFKEGHRGLAGDIEGATMRPQVAMLRDEQAMKDVVQYIATLK
jgi:cytochrome c oxidase subunit 2